MENKLEDKVECVEIRKDVIIPLVLGINDVGKMPGYPKYDEPLHIWLQSIPCYKQLFSAAEDMKQDE
jgi:hypothetical protein